MMMCFKMRVGEGIIWTGSLDPAFSFELLHTRQESRIDY